MNRNKEYIVFDLNKTGQASCLAIMLSEFQAKGVRYILEKDESLIYVHPE